MAGYTRTTEIQALEQVGMDYRVPLSAIVIPRKAYKLVLRTLRRKGIGQSDIVSWFENKIAAFVGRWQCIATASGTAADTIAVAAVMERYGVQRFVVPALTFAAHAN